MIYCLKGIVNEKIIKHVSESVRGLTLFERLLWIISELAVFTAFLVSPSSNPLTLAASAVGLTALIFTAKGDVIGQILIIIFSLLYAGVSYGEQYYGEMISYVFMSGGIAFFSTITWIKHPYKKHQVKVERLTVKKLIFMGVGTAAVTAVFYFILKLLGTASLTVSTVSIATSFIASSLTLLRSPFYALAYSVNDVVLIVLWIIAAFDDPYAIPMVVCFLAFLVNDLYGFFNWLKMRKQQSAVTKKDIDPKAESMSDRYL